MPVEFPGELSGPWITFNVPGELSEMVPHLGEFASVVLAAFQDEFNRDVRAKSRQVEVGIALRHH